MPEVTGLSPDGAPIYAVGAEPVDVLSGAYPGAVNPSYPTKQTPIEVQCGRSLFYLSRVGARDQFGPNLGTSIDFAFRDPDFQRDTQACGQFAGQTIDFIDAANMLPRGMTISQTMKNNVNGVSKVEIAWTPVCEDRSQVGMKKICFYAKDKSANVAFQPSYSVPTPQPALWTLPSADSGLQYHPTCIFIKSLAPAPNPPPVLNAFPEIPKVCCGSEFGQNAQNFAPCPAAGWADASGVKVGNEYVLGCTTGICNSKFTVVVAAKSDNDFFRTRIRFFYPGASNVQLFQVSAPKYGCDQSNFDTCTSNTDTMSQVATKLTVNIQPNMGQNVLRICYQGYQTSPADVDEAEWEALYGQPPTSQSCVTCFILNVINAPVWDAESLVPNDVPIFVAVGKKTSIKLTTRNLGSGSTNIFILADPGAPEGSTLTAIENDADNPNTFVRYFEYTPAVAHAGSSFAVCFTASTVQEGAAEPVDSDVLCYDLYVYVEQVTWNTIPCPFEVEPCRAQGVKVATVGCKTEALIQAKGGAVSYYDMKLRVPQLPQCSNCLEYSTKHPPGTHIGVSACSDTLTTVCCGDGICNGAESGYGLFLSLSPPPTRNTHNTTHPHTTII